MKKKINMSQQPEEAENRDPRIDFMAEFVVRSLRLKPDKWTRLTTPDDTKKFLNKFLDGELPQVKLHSKIFFNLFFP